MRAACVYQGFLQCWASLCSRSTLMWLTCDICQVYGMPIPCSGLGHGGYHSSSWIFVTSMLWLHARLVEAQQKLHHPDCRCIRHH